MEEFIVCCDCVEIVFVFGVMCWEVVQDVVCQVVCVGMLLMLNQMVVVGVVSLLGMMMGQVLVGQLLLQVVCYQIVIMFLIVVVFVFGMVGVVLMIYCWLFLVDYCFFVL